MYRTSINSSYLAPATKLVQQVVVSHIQRIGCQPGKNYSTLHGGQSRSWSAEQGKKKKKKSTRVREHSGRIKKRVFEETTENQPKKKVTALRCNEERMA